MNWKCVKDEKPILNKSVLIWRFEGKKSYVVAKLEQKENKLLCWRSFSGNILKIHEKDHWLEFPYLTFSETFT